MATPPLNHTRELFFRGFKFCGLPMNRSLVPRLSPRANEKSKKRGEPGRIYHVRNVIGRENLITCGRTNELAHAVRTEYSCDSFMADRMELDGTMLHYLAVRKALVSVQKPVYSKITLTYSLTWQADRCISRRMAFKALLNAKARPFPSLCSSFLCAYCWKKLPERASTQKTATCTVDCGSTIYVRGHIDDPPTLN